MSEWCVSLCGVICVQRYCRKESLYCGTTAVGAVVDRGGRRLTVFNIGDSQAVLCRQGEAVSVSTR